MQERAMPTTSSKKPSTSKGAKPVKSGSAAKFAKHAKATGGKATKAPPTGKAGRDVVTGRTLAPTRKSAAKHGIGSGEYHSEGAFASAHALPQMITRRITVRDQTTIPPVVREVLGLKGGGELGYLFDREGVRLVNPATVGEHVDPVLQQFLTLLGSHIAAGPAAAGAVAFPPALLERARALTADVEIDHEAPLDGAVLL
jgi:bifunctional DNA-binding transcriptional regulator/antitoxin component of YhaV-PrlF toxin-antitoxin module